MPKIPVTFDDVKTLAERSKTKTLGDSDLFAVEIAQEIKGLTKEDALETLGINDLDGRVQYLEAGSATEVLKDIKDNAKDATYDNSTSGLTAETLGGAIDEVEGRVDTVEGRVDTVEGEIDDLQTAETDIKGNGWTNENLVDHESRITQNESDIVALKGSGWAGQTVKGNADAIVELESRATDLGNSDVTLSGKIDAHEADTTNPHEVTKEQVGLDEVDNTADVDKPVSTAQQTALNNKADKDTDAVVGNFAYFDAEGNPVDSGKKDADYEDADATILKEADVVDSLESTSTTAPLSAKQGKVLNDAIGEVEGRVEDAEDDITAIKGVGYTEGTLKSHEDRLGTLEGADTIEGSVAKTVKDAVDPIIEDVSDHESRLDTLEADSATDGSILKSIKDNAENATFTPAVASGIESETLKEAVNELGGDVSDHETRIEALEETGGPPGPQGDDGLSAYEVAVEEGFVGDETAWLASLKGADGDDGLSAYEVAVEEGFVGDETAWLASLKGADGKSAYEYAEEEGYEGTEGEFAEALADVENKVDKSKIVTTWNSPKDDEIPSAKLVHESLNGGGGAPSDYIIIGLRESHSADDYDVAWEDIITDQPTWYNFWESFSDVHYIMKTFKFKRGYYRVPANVYYETGVNGHLIFPDSLFASFEGAGSLTEINVLPPAGGIVFSLDRMCTLKNMIISNSGMATYGVLSSYSEEGTPVYIENVIIKDMVGVGIACVERASNVVIKNCTTINCGSAVAGQQAAGIAVAKLTSDTPTNITIDGCTVIGGAYAGIGLSEAEDCKVVNCHVEDYGQMGIAVMGGKRNILANNTSIFNDGTQGEASPASQEFGILLSETEQCVVHGNNLPGSFLYEDNVTDCVVIDNIADNITPPNWEDKDNKLTAWGASPTDEQYPSAKLVKTALDGINVSGKEDKSNKITRLYDGVTDTQYASAKAVWDEFQIVKKATILESWDMFSEVTKDGRASDFVAPGDRLIGYWEVDGIYQPIPWEVLGIDQDEAVDESILHTVTLGTVDCLFSAMFDNSETGNPDTSRANNGNNNWELSNIRQYLNSEDVPFVHTPTHEWDSAPTGYPTNGFLARLHPTMRDVIVPVKKWTSLANIDVEGGVSDVQLDETIFLLSQKEVNGGTSNVGTVTNEFIYQRYVGAGNADRIKYGGAIARDWWTRSPNVSVSNIVRIVYDSGSTGISHANNSSYRVAPACVIG